MITNMGKVNHLRRLRRALLTAQAEAHEAGEYLAAHHYGEDIEWLEDRFYQVLVSCMLCPNTFPHRVYLTDDAQPGRGICGDCSAKLEDAVEKVNPE